MHEVLWILQGILAVKLISVAVNHGMRHNLESMQEAIQTLGLMAKPILALVAAITFLGSLGLSLPPLFRGPGQIVPISAAAMGFMLLLSIPVHSISRDTPNVWVSTILLVFAAAVAYGRWAVAPFS